MITAHRAQDIASALRLAKEFDIQASGSTAPPRRILLIDEIKAAGVPVIVTHRCSGRLASART